LPVISNSSPLIALSQIGRLDLLRQLNTRVSIPAAVEREVRPTLSSLPAWVLVQQLARPLQPSTVGASIRPGEREVISLGLEVAATLLILDEHAVPSLWASGLLEQSAS